MIRQFATLPSHWRVTRVDRVATVNARIGWKALTAAEYQSEGYAFLSTPNIKSSDIDFENVNYISEHRYEESPELKLRIGDVLLAKDGNTLGITNLVRQLPCPATVNGSIAVLRPFGIDSRFLRYVLASDALQQSIDALKGGMGVPHLFQRDIKRLPVPLPPPEEQRRIADFLDRIIGRLVRVQQQRISQRALLDERIQSLISEGLIPGILTRPLGRNPWPWLPELPGNVSLVRLGYLCRIQSGLTVDNGRELGADLITRPYLRVANVQAGSLNLDSVSEISIPRSMASRYTLQAGDVLMTEGGDLDKLGRGTVWQGEIENCLHQNHVFALRVNRSRLDPEYLALVTRSLHGRCYFESTGVKTTNLASTNSSKILGFPIPLPTINEQCRRVAEINGLIGDIEQTARAIDHQVTLLQERRQALITAAVTGQIDVTTARSVEA